MKISCIIPAYNEEKRIGNVIKIVQDHPLIDEIIVINDGSKDNTSEVVRKFKVKFIDRKENKGKSYTLMEGIKTARNDLLLFLDADLLGLTKEDITALIKPVIENKADISISFRNNILFWRIMGFDFLSGERVLPKTLFTDYTQLASLSGFGVETFMNKEIIKKKLRVKIVRWKKVVSPFPTSKVGAWQGLKNFFKMVKHIIKTSGILYFFVLVFKMRKLIVRD